MTEFARYCFIDGTIVYRSINISYLIKYPFLEFGICSSDRLAVDIAVSFIFVCFIVSSIQTSVSDDDDPPESIAISGLVYDR